MRLRTPVSAAAVAAMSAFALAACVPNSTDDAEAIAADMARICSGGSPLWIEVGGVKGECGRQNMDKVRGGAEILARLPKMH